MGNIVIFSVEKKDAYLDQLVLNKRFSQHGVLPETRQTELLVFGKEKNIRDWQQLHSKFLAKLVCFKYIKNFVAIIRNVQC